MTEIRKPWSAQEDQAVRAIVEEIGTKRWSAVSDCMLNQYGMSGRTGKQCRERWHNHLDPQINRKPWTQSEEKIVFQAHRKYGNKWTEIAQLLEGRTDNAVKNHFYSTIRRSLRRISKALGQKNSTSQMRDVKPSVLSEIFHYAQLPEQQQNSLNQEFVQDCKSLSQALLEFASLKSCTKGSILVETNREKLQSLYEKLMDFKEISMRGYSKRKSPPIFQINPIQSLRLAQERNFEISSPRFYESRTERRNKGNTRPIIIIKENQELKKQNGRTTAKKGVESPHASFLSSFDEELSSSFGSNFMNVKNSRTQPQILQQTPNQHKPKDSVFDWHTFAQKCILANQFAKLADAKKLQKENISSENYHQEHERLFESGTKIVSKDTINYTPKHSST